MSGNCVLLHGAKKNVGDFLIFERSKALIARHCRVDTFLELPRWKPLAVPPVAPES